MKKSILVIALLWSGSTMLGMDDDFDSTEHIVVTPAPLRSSPMQTFKHKRIRKSKNRKKHQEAPKECGADLAWDNQPKNIFAKKLTAAIEKNTNIIEVNIQSLERLAALKASAMLSTESAQYLSIAIDALAETTANLTLSMSISSSVLFEATQTQRKLKQKNELDID